MKTFIETTLKPDVSIIIVNWNTRELLQACLASIFRTTKPCTFEVLVVDNASEDGSPDMIRTEFPTARLIINQQNEGFAKANNQAIVQSLGRYILLLNSDTIICDHAVDKIVAFADSHQDAGIIGCRIMRPDGGLQVSCQMFPSLLNLVLSCTHMATLFPKSHFWGRELMTWWNYDELCEVDAVFACFLLTRRTLLQHVGLMDEQFYMYSEDIDWCYRCKRAGWKVLFTPVTSIIHYGERSSQQRFIVMTLQLWGSHLLFIKKYHSSTYYKTYCVLVVLFFAVRIVPLLLIGVMRIRKTENDVKLAFAYTKGIRQLLTHGANGLCLFDSTPDITQ